jgi:hypothetical protein
LATLISGQRLQLVVPPSSLRNTVPLGATSTASRSASWAETWTGGSGSGERRSQESRTQH